MNPLVTVICLCYNHRPFVRQAIESVIRQSYHPIQIIIVDDASQDGSVEEIRKLRIEYPVLETILLEENIGNCKAFNTAFKIARGDFIIDFATDDVMLPERLDKQVHCFAVNNTNAGVVFTDATYIDEEGAYLRHHFDHLQRKKLIDRIPQGDVYRDVVSTYFIPSPTMMIRRDVLDRLGGYDENLSYEDFDFWVRSARQFHYAFLPERLTFIRKLKKSMSAGWYVPGDKQLNSTFLVCKKVQLLNRDDLDDKALIKRVRYEFRQSVLSQNFAEADDFLKLLRELKGVKPPEAILMVARRYEINLSSLRRLYHKLRFS